ncbi:hypothetical protein DL769_007938 [Monosporascus sp. CRB-8-3]|nr:hypothetical protein DL769_007938 [Monosporascus sp. CRB-8-3]
MERKFVRVADAMDNITESLFQSCETGRKTLTEDHEGFVDDVALSRDRSIRLSAGMEKGRSVDGAIEQDIPPPAGHLSIRRAVSRRPIFAWRGRAHLIRRDRRVSRHVFEGHLASGKEAEEEKG